MSRHYLDSMDDYRPLIRFMRIYTEEINKMLDQMAEALERGVMVV